VILLDWLAAEEMWIQFTCWIFRWQAKILARRPAHRHRKSFKWWNYHRGSRRFLFDSSSGCVLYFMPLGLR